MDEYQELPVVGYEGLYMVSNDGNVRSLGGRRGSRPRMLKQEHFKGYRKVSLCRDGRGRGALVHRLVGQAFIPNPSRLPYINHIDGGKANNKVANLEWVDQQSNVTHAWSTGLMNNRGEKHGMHKLTELQVRAIKAYEDRTPARASWVAEQYKITLNTVHDIWTGRSWAHLDESLLEKEG